MYNQALHKTLLEFTQRGIDSSNKEKLGQFIAKHHAADLAGVLERLDPAEALPFFELLPIEEQAEVFGYFNSAFQQEMVDVLSPRRLAELVSVMDADERVDFFNKLDEEHQQAIMPCLAQAEREDIRKLASYREGTVGAVMTSDYAALTADLTVARALEKLRREAPDKETIYNAYVVDEQRRLLGVVSLKDLILARPEAKVQDLMNRGLVVLRAEEPQSEAAAKIARYDLLAIPVINGDDKLAGIVTHDDALDVSVQEATEDFHRMAGMTHKSPGLGEVNMLDASPWLIVQKRLPWLLILVFMNIFSGAGIAFFEDTIEAVVALVFFLPLLIDSGGNAGSQASTLMIRALATGRAHLKDWFALLGKEVGVALLLGGGMALAVSVVGIFRAGPEVAMVVAVAMVCTVLFGSLVGMSLPFVLSKLKLDPATASAPLVTSIADIGGVLIYFSLATWLLRDMIVAAGAG
ncbi:magnesium transporter [Desulfurivibrio alkaliphilus]|uniref:Magnesium transporter MgtE n=1 Tax=Desulfurivibrio alkaliphilus (strain DSM 19089 / UNIQEM U267 / AHT2) TaxID=589865 RepID=D6Z072_DESAT|nr:magnesium transporter [Desulfurivibrio alkaliphilus]ADH87105.1 magnesium transporter [Desulfurivibrio alkaliphilus AHT 2]